MLIESFPGPSGIVDSTKLRKDLSGLLVRNTDGTPRAGVFYRGPATAIGAARAGDMKIDVRAYNAALVRTGPLFTQNDGTMQSPTLTVPSSNQIIHVVYQRQNESASPYGDADNTTTLGFVSSGQSANPQLADALALLPPGALPLVSVQVPSTAVTTASAGVVIKDIAPFTALTGGKVAFRTLIDLQAWTTAPLNQDAFVFSDTTAGNNGTWTSDGAGGWQASTGVSGTFTPTVTAATTSPSGLTAIGRFRYVAPKLVHVYYQISIPTGANGGNGGWSVALPPGMTAPAFGEQDVLCKGYTNGPFNWDGFGYIAPSTNAIIPYLPASPTAANLAQVANSTNGGTGTGVPLISGAYTFTGSGATRTLVLEGVIEIA